MQSYFVNGHAMGTSPGYITYRWLFTESTTPFGLDTSKMQQ